MWLLSGIRGSYEAWAFGEKPDELAELVRLGRKTATSSAFPAYEAGGEPLPRVGEYSVIIDSLGQAVCVIRTTKVCIVPFDEVTERHAALEGEGDLSLGFWRTIHRAFFSAEMEAIHQAFSEKMNVVCEEFTKVFPD